MGYTHYWTVEEDIPQEDFDKFRDDFRKISEEAGISTEIDENEENHVKYWPDETHDRCEAFRVARSGNGFNFCKTRYYLYSKVVCAGLISLAFHTDADISSDGRFRCEFDDMAKDWQAGYALYLRATESGEPSREDCRKFKLVLFQ